MNRGAALIFALVVVLISSLFILAMGTFALQHLYLEQTESDYGTALYSAEAALNYELNKISRDPYQISGPTCAADNTSAGAYNGTLSNAPCSTVAFPNPSNDPVKVYVTHSDGVDPWLPGSNMIVWASGTHNGVSRRIEAFAGPEGLGDTYAIYGASSLTLNSTATINGNIGTAGTLTNNGLTSLNGTCFLETSSAAYNGVTPSWDTLRLPNATPWPTVSSVISTVFPESSGYPDPITYIAGHNDDFRTISPGITSIMSRDASGNLAPFDTQHFSASDPALNSTVFSDNHHWIVLIGDGSTAPNGMTRGSTLYFTHISLGPQDTLEILNNLPSGYPDSTGAFHGPVRIIVGPSGGTSTSPVIDLTKGNLITHDPHAAALTLYNATAGTAKLGDAVVTTMNDFNPSGGVQNVLPIILYAYNGPTDPSTLGIHVVGNLNLWGSLVADRIMVNGGNMTVTGNNPNQSQISDSRQYIVRYIIKSFWLERNPLANYGLGSR